MKALRPGIATLCLAALCGSAQAQRTWVVAADGSGDFTDLPPALAVAVHGDVIELRPAFAASYTAGSTNQGITIRGSFCTFLPDGALRVHDLPAGETFAWEGICGGFGVNMTVELVNNRGTVFFDQLNWLGSTGRPSFRATDCDMVIMQRSNWITDLEFVRSRALMTSCNLIGTDFDSGYPALRMVDSDVTMEETIVAGPNFFPPVGSPFVARPGIDMTRGRLEIRGIVRSVISGGVNQRTGVFAPAISTNGGTVEIDPRVRIGTRPGIVGSSAVRMIARPLLDLPVNRAPTIRGLDGSVSVLVLSVLRPPIPTTWGGFWLEPQWSHVFDVGIVQSGQRQIVYQAPALPISRFLAFQAAVVEPSGALWFTNPVFLDAGTVFP